MNSNLERALVLERWNSWVRLYLPSTGETRWVDMAERSWSATSAPSAHVVAETVLGPMIP